MSVLIPSNEPLIHRVCPDQHWWNLLAWFSAIEGRAWEAACAAWSGSGRPDKIFLVTGQTLTSEYSICHQEQEQSGCETIIKTSVSLPSVVDGGVYLGTRCEQVSASTGFEISSRVQVGNERSSDVLLHSIFFETTESSPINRFLFERPCLLTRVTSMYRYLEYYFSVKP